MQQFRDIPELQLSEATRGALVNELYTRKDNGVNVYQGHGGIFTVSDFSIPDELADITRRVNHIHRMYFMFNVGCIKYHRDQDREAVISFELKNPNGINTDLYTDSREHIGELVYRDNIPLLWNTQCMHMVRPSPSERVFMQIELNRDRTYAEYVELYESGELINY